MIPEVRYKAVIHLGFKKYGKMFSFQILMKC